MFVAGQSIGNYRILSKVGTGGMGAVYLAEHPLIGKRVALKVIHRELAGNRDVVQRFFQEARAVNKIGHVHIVEIHDFAVTSEGDHFYIMEYLEGRTLASVLAQQPILDVVRALHIAAQMASALAAAHAAGVIHRDLKPDNIMLIDKLGDRDFVKVLDFGLAKMFAAGDSSVRTAAGVVLGTPQYMSPEACESKRDIDHRTDIYALGILLFQMLTGRLPFDGESMGEVLVKQVTGLPPGPRGLNPRIPPSVEQIVLRCLAKSPDARFPTMLALRDALLDPEGYLGTSPPIAAARSVAPGEAPANAADVLAYVAAQQAAKAASALPLQAPPTLVSGAPSDGAPAASRGTGVVPVPGLIHPAAPMNRTMVIATPVGYSSRPPRKMWPIVLLVGLALGLGGGMLVVSQLDNGEKAPAIAVAGSGSGSGPRPETRNPKPETGIGIRDSGIPGSGSGMSGSGSGISEAGNGNGNGSGSGSGSGSRVSDAGSGMAAGSAAAPPARATIAIDTVPVGAEVVGPDHAVIGKTPLRFELALAPDPVTIEIRLAGYRTLTRELTVSGDVSLQLDLERGPASPPAPRGAHHGHGSASALMRPDDL